MDSGVQISINIKYYKYYKYYYEYCILTLTFWLIEIFPVVFVPF